VATFTIESADFDVGVCTVKIDLPGGGHDLIKLNPFSICASDDATEAQLRDAIGQLVEVRLAQLFPPPPPRPAALLAMVGRTFVTGPAA